MKRLLLELRRFRGWLAWALICKTPPIIGLLAWKGNPPNEDDQTRHLNGRPDDNRLENLAWGTAQQNMDDREAHGRTPKGAAVPTSKLTEAEVVEIRARGRRGTLAALGREFGVSDVTIRAIVNRRTWKHV